MTQFTEEKPFSVKLREAAIAFGKRPLAERLAVLVQTGAITEADRQRAIQRNRRKRKK